MRSPAERTSKVKTYSKPPAAWNVPQGGLPAQSTSLLEERQLGVFGGAQALAMAEAGTRHRRCRASSRASLQGRASPPRRWPRFRGRPSAPPGRASPLGPGASLRAPHPRRCAAPCASRAAPQLLGTAAASASAPAPQRALHHPFSSHVRFTDYYMGVRRARPIVVGCAAHGKSEIVEHHVRDRSRFLHSGRHRAFAAVPWCSSRRQSY